MDPRFLLLILETARGKYEIKSYLSGSVRDSLAFEDLKSIEISVPPEEKWGEIVNIFNIIDTQYELYNDKLSSLKRQRKVLQQYLLNGIVRVK
jgi:restriction endonuclease S subunit